jgi:hypothetical protein
VPPPPDSLLHESSAASANGSSRRKEGVEKNRISKLRESRFRKGTSGLARYKAIGIEVVRLDALDWG